MLFGYGRISTHGQNDSRQVKSLLDYGISEKDIFIDEISGSKFERPKLNDMLSRLREGDAVVITSLDRLGRSTVDLIELSNKLNDMGVNLISLKETIDTSTPQGRFFFRTMASMAEFERELINERRAEGMAIAKANGNVGGRPRVNQEVIESAMALYDAGGMSVSAICRSVGITRATFYNYLKKYQPSRITKK